MNDLAEKKSPGNQPLTEAEVFEIFRQLEPHLKLGLSLNKSRLEANLPKTTIYELYENNEWFQEHVDQAMQHVAILISDSSYQVIKSIGDKQAQLKILEEQYTDGIIEQKEFEDRKKTHALTKEEYDFLKWYATTSKRTRDEFGSRSEVTGKDDAPLIPPALTSAKSIETILKTYEKVREQLNGQPQSNL